MRVFVTGATGFIGRAVVAELLSAGHTVVGLARSDENAKALIAVGAQVHRGDLTDLESLKAGAAASEGVIHLAFNHDFSDWAATCENDRRAIEALGSGLIGTNRPLITTSGTLLLAMGTSGLVASEESQPPTTVPRVASEELTKSLASRGVRSAVIRLAPSVHGTEDKGFMPHIISSARSKGVSAYIGDGRQRWPAVHRLDAAKLYRLALEKGTAGAIYNGIADQGVELRQVAEVIGRKLNLPVVSKTPEEATDHFGFLGRFVQLDNPASSKITQQQLGWTPSQPGLIQDLEQGNWYFNKA